MDARPLLVSLIIVLSGLVMVSTPGTSNHTPETNVYSKNVEIHDRVIDDSFEVRHAERVVLQNVTIRGGLYLHNVASANLSDVRIQGAFFTSGLRTLNQTRTDVNQSSYHEGIDSLAAHDSTYQQNASFYGVQTGSFYRTKFVGSLCAAENTTLYFTETTPASPSPGTCAPLGRAVYRYNPNATTSGYYPMPTYTYSPPPPTPPTPPSQPTPASYTYEFQNGTIAQDVYVYGAQRVTIRNAHIRGELGIGRSTQVVLDQVRIDGNLTLTTVRDIKVGAIVVSQNLYMSDSSNFRVADSKVDRDLGCHQCSLGSFVNVGVGGFIYIFESPTVTQENVYYTDGRPREPAAPTYPTGPDYPIPTITPPTFPAAPMPTPSKEEGLQMAVSSESVVFVHERSVNQYGSVQVRVNVSFEAVVRLELARPERPGEPPVHLDSEFEKLIEYEDRDGNGAYDLGDQVLREYIIDELPLSQVGQERLSGMSAAWVGRMTYALPNGGAFALVMTTQDAKADATKVDVEIHNYEYASESSALALQIRLASASDWEIQEGFDKDQILFHGPNLDGYFSWVKRADADGVPRPVNARVLEEHRTESGEREVVLLLAYPRGRDIIHDPEIGILESETLEAIGIRTLGDLVVYVTTITAVVAFLWAISKGGSRPGRRQPTR